MVICDNIGANAISLLQPVTTSAILLQIPLKSMLLYVNPIDTTLLSLLEAKSLCLPTALSVLDT